MKGYKPLLFILLFVILMIGTGVKKQTEIEKEESNIFDSINSMPTPEPIPEPEPDPTEEYAEAARYIAKTIYGEARGESVTDQAAVAWCILNRVDQRKTQTPKDVIKVVTQKNQFYGYHKRNPVKEEHYELAMDVISRWLREKAGETDVGRVLPKEYTFFAAYKGRNRFRDAYRNGKHWDWSLPSPYES